MGSKPYIGSVVSVAELAAMRQGDGDELRPWASIGEQVGYSDDAVRRYGLEVLGPELLVRARRRRRAAVAPVRDKWESDEGCTRCGWLGGERNPLTPNKKCLWCNMEEQGIVLHEAVDSGLMGRMIEAVKAAMAGASDG